VLRSAQRAALEWDPRPHAALCSVIVLGQNTHRLPAPNVLSRPEDHPLVHPCSDGPITESPFADAAAVTSRFGLRSRSGSRASRSNAARLLQLDVAVGQTTQSFGPSIGRGTPPSEWPTGTPITGTAARNGSPIHPTSPSL